MSALLIVGAGGHGRVVADAALESGRWERIAFLDDFQAKGSTVLGLPVAGRFSELSAEGKRFGSVVIALGGSRERLELIAACVRVGFELPCIVHPSATVSRFATLGAGGVVLAQAAINAGARMGVGCIVNTGATVDHDCELGSAVHVCPGAHLAGTVRVGDLGWIGVGASVRQGISIGARVTIGAGAAVIADIPDDATVLGVPARPRSVS